jgi:hypothetical protein
LPAIKDRTVGKHEFFVFDAVFQTSSGIYIHAPDYTNHQRQFCTQYLCGLHCGIGIKSVQADDPVYAGRIQDHVAIKGLEIFVVGFHAQ